MVRIIPESVFKALSAYECMLLLLAAYLHDIGMTPEQRRVSRHLTHLLFPKDPSRPEDWLTEVEAAALQEWLDSDGRGIVAPITDGKASEADLRLAHELITLYTRHRHNEWSTEFIRREFADEALPHYPDWQRDLITLCRSHHQYYDDLASAQFDPKPAGSDQTVVHLRYLACLLRVADVLDVDPERTPEVIFRHRTVAPGSELHWRKGHVTWIQLAHGTAQVSLVARPDHAVLERAIRETANAIGTELQVCARLAREHPFEHCPFSGAQIPQYIWALPAWLHVDVHPQPNAYVYIDGAFRPNTERLLSLFAGTGLYSQKFDAVRELLQNAFDAVREAIAYERLADAGTTPGIEKILAQKHLVQLRLEADATPAYLVCSDTGAGMNRDIIEKHLLVSGTGQRREILELERRCESAGFPLGRTGRFGIGVLAYFMLAERLQITTRRHQGAEGDEGHGWSFETTGVGSFGELRVNNRKMPGSEIRLTLREAELGDAVKWFANLKNYLIHTLVYVPCRFELTTILPSASPLSLSPGWALTPESLLETHLAHTFRPSNQDDELVTGATVEAIKASAHRLEEALKDASNSINWIVSQGELPNAIGEYRLIFPFFKLGNELSLAYLPITESNGQLQVTPIGSNVGALMAGSTIAAWRGMQTGGFRCETAHAFAQINFTNASVGELKINRSHISITEKSEASVTEFLLEKEQALIEEYWHRRGSGKFAFLDSAILQRYAPADATPWWLRIESRTAMLWQPIAFPVTDHAAVTDALFNAKKVTWAGTGVASLSPVPLLSPNYKRSQPSLSKIPWCGKALEATDHFRVVPVWTAESLKMSSKYPDITLAEFPPDWPVIGFIPIIHRGIWNTKHPIIAKLDVNARQWAAERFESSLNPLPFREDIMTNAAHAAAWLFRVFRDDVEGSRKYEAKIPRELWKALVEKHSDFLAGVWRVIFDISVNSLAHSCVIRITPLEVHVVSCAGWMDLRPYAQDAEIRRYLPLPSEQWRCTIST